MDEMGRFMVVKVDSPIELGQRDNTTFYEIQHYVNGPEILKQTVQEAKLNGLSKLNWAYERVLNRRSFSKKVNGPKNQKWMILCTKSGRSKRSKLESLHHPL